MAHEEKYDIKQKLSELKSSLDGLSNQEVTKRLTQYGSNELTEKHESILKKFLMTYWGPIPWLIEIAAVLSAVIQHWSDFAVIALMLVLNSLIEFIQSKKAADALAALKSSMALKSRAQREGKWCDVLAKNLVPGDIIHLENGDIIPADCVLLKGEYLLVDQAALTGESLPANKTIGAPAYSGSIVKQGNMTALVTETGSNTFFGRTAKLVQTAGTTSHFQKSILNIGKFLICGALLFAAVIILKAFYLHENPLNTIEFVLVLIIASIPVAMPAVLSVTMALGALALSKKKAIVSHLQELEELAAVDVLCTDKTGTLTKNELILDKPILYSQEDANSLKIMAALASSQEGKDAIDNIIINSIDQNLIKDYQQVSFIPFDPVGKKTEATIQYQGETFKIIKGAPQVIIELCHESDVTKKKALQDVQSLAMRGLRSLGVAKTDSAGKYRLLGILSLYDPPRDDSKQVIAYAKDYGLTIKMATGDDLAIGKEIASQLNIGSNLVLADDIFAQDQDMDNLSQETIDKIIHADGFTRVFPEHKYGIVKALQKSGKTVGMTGDGVNDAPALKQADVGIAVSGATDAARSAADLILTLPGLSVIIEAIKEARKIFNRMISYINYRVAMTINIMVFVTLAILMTNIAPLTPIMIVLLALLDDLPIITIAYDHTRISQKPMKWHMGSILSIASVLGLVSVLENFILLYLAKHYLVDNIYLLRTIMFLQLVASAQLLLLISRHQGWFWEKPWPSLRLLTAIASTQIAAIVICKVGLLMHAISWNDIGFVWGYAIIWMFILNVARKLTEGVLHTLQKV